MKEAALPIEESQAKGAGTSKSATELIGLDASKASVAVAVVDSGQAHHVIWERFRIRQKQGGSW